MNMIEENAIRESLRSVIDPELGANIVDLNMIRKIEINEDKVKISLVLTVPSCPLAGWIIQQIRNVVSAIEGVKEVVIELLDEPWMLNDDWKSWLTNNV